MLKAQTARSNDGGDGPRFDFGSNWARFVERVGESQIAAAEEELKHMLGVDRLDGQRFLDAGSGSGLSSLAACRMGATVVSFDHDRGSVASTSELRERFADADKWTVTAGSILDEGFLRGLGTFDVVYSWGVVHHTGAMWKAVDNLMPLVAPGGTFFIAIYNDQGWKSRVWRRVKKVYNASPRLVRYGLVAAVAIPLWGFKIARDALHGTPLKSWKQYYTTRGMSPVTDVVDWVGGYPFEVASPGKVIDYCRKRGFDEVHTSSVGKRLGCNEFVFRRVPD